MLLKTTILIYKLPQSLKFIIYHNYLDLILKPFASHIECSFAMYLNCLFAKYMFFITTSSISNFLTRLYIITYFSSMFKHITPTKIRNIIHLLYYCISLLILRRLHTYYLIII